MVKASAYPESIGRVNIGQFVFTTGPVSINIDVGNSMIATVKSFHPDIGAKRNQAALSPPTGTKLFCTTGEYLDFAVGIGEADG
jgi:hypothetical protein